MLLSTGQVLAAHGASLYYVEKLVPDESRESRWRAFVQGLDEVFVRIAGDSLVMSKLKRPPASRYVQQFSYEPLQTPVVNDEDEVLGYRIKLQYNGKLMEKYLRENNFPVWGEHRPDVVVWLVVNDGSHRYVLRDADQSAIKTAMDEALHRRGIPGRWPRYDAEDREKLHIADIQGGFRDQIEAASRRYTRGPALAGSLLWNGRQWQSSWSLLIPGAERHWSLVDADYRQLIDKAVDQAADAMGQVYAVHAIAGGGAEVVVQLQVDGVDSVSRYRQLESYLAGLNMVERLLPVEVDGNSVRFKLALRTDADDFLGLIDSEDTLQKVAVPVVRPSPQPDPSLPPGAAATPGGIAPDAPSGATTTGPAVSPAPADKPVATLYHYRLSI